MTTAMIYVVELDLKLNFLEDLGGDLSANYVFLDGRLGKC